MRFIVLFVLLMSSAWARPQWADLEIGQEFRLTHDFAFPNGFTLPKGEAVTIIDWVPLDMISVQLIEAKVHNCTFPGMELEVEIFPVPTEIGLAIVPDCVLWFYYENKDIYTEAPLE